VGFVSKWILLFRFVEVGAVVEGAEGEELTFLALEGLDYHSLQNGVVIMPD
jgi:hypothetical protein